ncbi:MAG: CoB--CoM heterodisulfide reductase iron-sulfur subunit B family protein [Firmicutes bacterium]|nr:CoB--CoM heterodisulfide reductase iron-sulfur subunit B family protein [Bacillota bacterium]
MNIAYYPGCSLHTMAHEYDMSARLVSQRLGIELQEVPDWNCCGATAAHSLDHKLAIALNSRNLALVAAMPLPMVTTPCAGCFSRLKTTAAELKNDSVSAEMENLTGFALAGARQVEVAHLLQLMTEEIGLEAISKLVVKPLNGMKLAAYYGCLITRPRRIVQFDDPEQPVSMDQLLQCLGAETVNWSHKAECCGGGFAASQTDIVVDLGGQVLEAARQAGADAIVVACPMCQANLDTRQKAIEADRRTSYNLPIVYFTQLMGLALGLSAHQLGLNRLLTSSTKLLSSSNLA